MEEVKNVVANENFDWNAFENDLGVYDQDKAQITEAYDKTLSNVNVGEVVEGTVTGVNKREVIVNVGYKSEGIIPVSEFRYNPDLKVGDKIEVYVESVLQQHRFRFRLRFFRRKFRDSSQSRLYSGTVIV